MLKREDRPLFGALLLIVVALALNAAVSFAESPPKQSNSRADNKPAQIPEWLWGAAEALATGIIAVYAIRQYGESAKSSERQLRAYVAARGERVRGCNLNEAPVMDIKIQNYGETPAYLFRQASRAGYGGFPLIGAIPYPDFEDAEGQMLAPGDHVFSSADFKTSLTRTQRNAINSGAAAIYFAGQFEYFDAFGKRRWVKYCFYSGGDIDLGGCAQLQRGNVTSEDEESWRSERS